MSLITALSTTALFRVDGMVAVITGGGTGIGLVMARALAANGARRVFLLGRRTDVVEHAAAAANAELGLADANDNAVLVGVTCDVTDKASLQAAVDAVRANLAGADRNGQVGVNLVVCNAGTSGPPAMRYDPALSVAALRQRLFVEAAPAAMTAAFAVNVTGAFFTAMAFLDLLEAGNAFSPTSLQSQIVVTSSIAAYMRGRFSPAPYVGSKAAVLQLTKQLAAMLSPYGIRANALAPGLFPTELAAGLTNGRDPSAEGYDHPMFTPARRFGTDADMAGTILYLASAAGGFCNGLVLAFDGGRMAVTNASY